ncbi:MAG: MBL fold metallo-hydrolase [Bryobacteraceae bacterium]|jgi:glyoxylase-like metal-dependent hydrolase (beta-lactamase superfamily II)
MHAHSRRGFLTQTLGGGFLGASLLEQAFFRATLARAQAPLAPSDVFEIEKVAEGVYAAVARGAAITNCNAAIFENASDLLVVDTHSKPSAVAALVAQIRKDVTAKPVRYVVETHFHWDHTQGAHEYKRIAPDAEIISSTVTRGLIAEFGAARLRSSLEGLPAALDNYQRQLAAAGSPEQKAHFEKMIAGTRAYMAQMRDYQPELPDLTFSENLVLHDKAHELHLAFRGRGHTAGDVVVFCPQKRVLATGDLLHSWLPYLADAYPREWPRTLRTVAGFDFAHVIGGHGGVQHSPRRLEQFAGYIEELTEAVAAGKSKGRTVEQIQSAITPASLKSLGGGYGEFVGGQITHYDGPQELANAADVVAGSVKGNIADIYSALEKT